MKSFYQILNISPKATQQRFHPDKNTFSQSIYFEEKMVLKVMA